jgi:hypothetical protein
MSASHRDRGTTPHPSLSQLCPCREYRAGRYLISHIGATAILANDIERDGADGDEYPPARQTGTAVATESRRGGAAEKFPPEPDGERAQRAA